MNLSIDELRASIQHSPIATCITDPRLADNPIVEANEAFSDLTGYRPEEFLGRNCRFLAGAATDDEPRRMLRQAILEERPAIVELTNYRRDGSAFRNAVMVAPIRDDEGRTCFFYGSQMDVGAVALDRGEEAAELLAGLTLRQHQVLHLMSRGFRNKQIGFELGIGEKTVKMHRALMLKALGVATSADAIRIAVEGGLAASDRDQ